MEAGNGFLYTTLPPIIDGYVAGVVQEESTAEILELPSSSTPAAARTPSPSYGGVRLPAWTCVDQPALASPALLQEDEISEEEEDGEVEFISLGDEEEVKEVTPAAEPEIVLGPVSQTSKRFSGEVWPWVQGRTSSFRSPLLELHQEILDFCKFISPTEEEHSERVLAVERVSDCIKSLWPDCKVQVFGSFATGLYLPSSDIDVVILDSGCQITQNGLRALSKVIRKRGLARKIVVIAKARVPLVKFVDEDSGISFDISFDLKNGPEAAKFIQRTIASLPPLRPLCMVLKIFLQQRDLNEVYQGGVGSYALLVMLLAHLQLHPSRQSFSPLESNLGVLLIDFLDLYGRTLNVKEVGVSCTDGGRFFSKTARGFYDYNKPYLLSVEDPQAPENDIGKNSFNFVKVRAAFSLAHNLLTSSDASLGILGRIIRLDEKLSSRKRLEIGDPVPAYFFDNQSTELRARSNKRHREEEDNPENDKQRGRGNRKKNKVRHERDEGLQLGRKRKRRQEMKDREERIRPRQMKKKESGFGNGKKSERGGSSSGGWKKVEDMDVPSPIGSSRTNYTDHYDHGTNKKAYVTSGKQKKIKF